MDSEKLFWKLYEASIEADVDQIIHNHPHLSDNTNWKPYGQNESNFAVVENQQASPIPALVEKIINSIDAILMRRCYEQGLDPLSAEAPRSVEDAVECFFPDASSWDLPSFRKNQAESIQIIADGPRMETSLVIYDDGEGQKPEEFEATLLSLLRGNKNEIHFVQGKYNMGGAGAIAFAGKNRYQLVASKRWDGNGEFGFTLVRRHPLTEKERSTKKNTWYEYFTLDGKIASFPIDTIDIGLFNRMFKTGTIIKLYSYDLPSGSRSVISRDLNQSINEYLFSPALPVFTIDKPERYPLDHNLQRDLYGLQRRLEEEGNKYVEEYFSEEFIDEEIGQVKITCYVFKPRIEGKSVKESKDSIQREFFKNNMPVIFSINGQVHGHYTSEFITRSLKFQLLRNSLLIHVDCTNVQLEFRNELFMASRDRLKAGEESRRLRTKLSEMLSKGRLKEINKKRRASITVESEDTNELLRNFTKNLHFQDDLVRLLGQTFKLDDHRQGKPPVKKPKKPSSTQDEGPVFNPQRFPSFFKIDRKSDDVPPIIKVPLGGERTIRFHSDIEDQYFDRVTEPGELKIALLGYNPNDTAGGTKRGTPDRVEKILNVVKSSPHQGIIKVVFNPTKKAEVGDSIELKAVLSGAGQEFEEIFFIKVTDPTKKKNRPGKGPDEPDQSLGLPKLILVYKDNEKEGVTWDRLESEGIQMDYEVVVHPLVEDDVLSTIYVNMDSSVLLNNRSKLSTEDQITISEKRYISAIYFHSLFLYMITKNRNYIFRQEKETGNECTVEITDYLMDLFQNHYAEFLLNFEVQELIAALD